MASPVQIAAASRLRAWIGWAGMAALGRLMLLAGSTAIFSRLLLPAEFGLSALVLSATLFASVFVGTPFQEALSQRRVLRRAHLEAALAIAWLAALALLPLSVLGGWLLATAYHEPQLRELLPVAALSLFFTAHCEINTALARRLRRFTDIAAASLWGHAIGIGLAVALAFAGAGLWALIAQRLLVVIAEALVLEWRVGFILLPKWSPAHVNEIRRFASFSFLDVLIDKLVYLTFNYVVGAFYGTTALGYVNMAMRLIEPVRGLVIATGHNIAFSFFAMVGHDRAMLRARAERVVSGMGLVIAPIFIGLAAVMPILLPLVAGPGWDEAVGIAVWLAIGGAVAVPARIIYTAMSASARPEYSVLSAALSFAAMMLILLCGTSLGPIEIGIARFAGDAVQAALAISFSLGGLVWTRSGRLGALLPGWMLAGAMGAVVFFAGMPLTLLGKGPALAASVLLGIGIYAALLGVFAPARLEDVLATVWPRRHP